MNNDETKLKELFINSSNIIGERIERFEERLTAEIREIRRELQDDMRNFRKIKESKDEK